MNRVPDHLEESDLLAIAEGESLAARDPKAIRSAIEADPALGRLLLNMRQDRDALRLSAAETFAPAGLVAGIEARLEREALAGWSVAAAESEAASPLPVSSVVYHRSGAGGVLGRVMQSVKWQSTGVRRLAVAAALVLGGVTVGLLVRNAINAGGSTLAGSGSGGEIVATHGDRPEGASDPVRSTDNDSMIARENSSAHEATALTGVGVDKDEARAIAGMCEPVGESGTGAGVPKKPVMTLAKAIELAGAGRLVIRVASERTTAAEEVRGVVARSPKEVWWKSLEPSSSVSVALAAKFGGVERAAPTKPTPGEQAVAGENGTEKAPGVIGTNSGSAGTGSAGLAAPTTMYVVEFDGHESRLSSILNALARASSSEVELIELDEPIGVSAGLDPAAMLWWGRKPEDWVRRVAAAVVVGGAQRGE